MNNKTVGGVHWSFWVFVHRVAARRHRPADPQRSHGRFGHRLRSLRDHDRNSDAPVVAAFLVWYAKRAENRDWIS